MSAEPTEMAGVAEAETGSIYAWALDYDDPDEFPTLPAQRLTSRRITALGLTGSLVAIAVTGVVALGMVRQPEASPAPVRVIETVTPSAPTTVTVTTTPSPPPAPAVTPTATPEAAAVPSTACSTLDMDTSQIVAKSLLYPDHHTAGSERYSFNLQAVAGPNGPYEYVAGDIWEGRMSTAHRVTSGEVWVIRDGTIYSVTDTARQWSTLPDGSGLALDSARVAHALDCARTHRESASY